MAAELTDAPAPWLPRGGVLLHIGPHKTGTTGIQAALSSARAELEKQGIVYPGSTGQHAMAALAVTDRSGQTGRRPTEIGEWERLVGDVRAARRRRTVVSAEAFVQADAARSEQIVEALGGDRVHVVMTLRPLAKILPSAWQQNVRSRLTMTYEEWLDQILHDPDHSRRAANFWRRHRHEEVADRWIRACSTDRFAVVVADDADRQALPRRFEYLLGLPAGFLLTSGSRENRGLTAQEIELVRRLNVAFADNGWSDAFYHRVVRLGVIQGMQRRVPAPDEARITTPAWAVERANEIAAQSVAAIQASGVRVLGNLDTLSDVAADATVGTGKPDDCLTDPAVELALNGVRDQLEQLRGEPPAEGNARPVDAIATAELAAIVRDRLSRRVRAALGLGVRRY